MTIATGVYIDVNNYSALVFKVDDDTVYYVANLEGKVIDAHAAHVGDFVHRYKNHLQDYPTRRCARVYIESYFHKSPLAQRVLNHLLRS